MKIKHIILGLSATMLLTACGGNETSNSNGGDGSSNTPSNTSDAELSKSPIIDEKTATYGLYPQTHVSDADTISALDALTTAESNGWYLYKGEYYAKKTANPSNSDYKFNDGTTIEYETDYWFKCELINWKILNKDDENATYTLVSTVILDAHRYNEMFTGNSNGYYANNYMHSEIREWLNDDFYKAAFNLNSSYIETTNVDNSAATTKDDSNQYACENTEDNIYLLSYQDYLNPDYGFVTSDSDYDNNKACKTTDYARACGAGYLTDSTYLYNGDYWTRSPIHTHSLRTWGIYNDGRFDYENTVINTTKGVCPAITVKYSA